MSINGYNNYNCDIDYLNSQKRQLTMKALIEAWPPSYVAITRIIMCLVEHHICAVRPTVHHVPPADMFIAVQLS